MLSQPHRLGITASNMPAAQGYVQADSHLDLAGAMGKPVWILLPQHADWRWMQDREDSPWYARARLFRQARQGDWDGLINRVCDDLAELAATATR